MEESTIDLLPKKCRFLKVEKHVKHVKKGKFAKTKL